ncbi:MAG: HD domain-containing protein [Candidatus Latescibacteria bacterium]|nr:HD domain-containing protein [Candidatus Latescibacterota bacterium]
MDRLVCCYNTRGIIGYVKRHYPELLKTLYEDLDPSFDTVYNVEEFLLDEHNWISQKVFVELVNRIKVHSGDPNIAREIGRESIIHRSFGYLENIFIKAIGHPYLSIRRTPEINAKFNRTKEVEIVESDWSHAILRLKWFEGLGSTRDVCQYNFGIYETIPTLWGLPEGKITELKCQFHGDEYCEFKIEWAKKSVFALIFGFFTRRREVLNESLAELEREKALTERKYIEVENLNVELNRRIERLTSLNACSKATASILDTDKLLDVVVSLITNIMRFDRAIILLIDEKGKCLRPVKTAGATDDAINKLGGYTIPLERTQNILARVVNSGVAQKVTDVDHSFLRKENIILKKFNPKSFVAVPLITRNKVIGVLAAERTEGLKDFTSNDLEYVMNFCNQIAISLENARLIEDMKQSYMSSILSLASALEAKDPYTRGHSNRVATYSTMIARNLKLDEERVEKIRLMALMHDIGKIGIPDSIIDKPGKLDQDEINLIKRHPLVGLYIIGPLLSYDPEISLMKSHHERFDGFGYPEGLAGTDIPLEARIMGVADSFDAMTTDRPYRKAMSREEAIAEIQRNKGTQFCPVISDVFISIATSMSDERFDHIRNGLSEFEEQEEQDDIDTIITDL